MIVTSPLTDGGLLAGAVIAGTLSTVTPIPADRSVGLQPEASQLVAFNVTGPSASDHVDHGTDALPLWTSTGEPIGVAPAKNCTRGATELAVIVASPQTTLLSAGCEMLGIAFERSTAIDGDWVALQLGLPPSQSAADNACAPFANDQLDHAVDADAGLPGLPPVAGSPSVEPST